MKKLLKYFIGYRKECFLGPLFKLIEAGLELSVPLVVAHIVTYGINAKDTGVILRYGLLLALLGLLGLVFSVTAQYFAAKASTGFTRRVKAALFAHITKLSYADLDRLGSDTLITRMTGDAAQVQTGLNLALRLLLRSPFVVFGAMILAFTVDASAALPFAVVIPLLFLVVFALMLSSIPLYQKVQKGVDRLTGRTRQTLAGTRVIRAFCREEAENAAFDAENESLTRLSRLVGRISALMNPLTYVIVNAAALWLIARGAVRMEAGTLSDGALIALYNYMAQILVELLKLASLIITITRSLASASRIAALLDVTPSMTYGERDFVPVARGEEILRFDNVFLRYEGGGEDALAGVSFSLRQGETLGILGPTGAGKSTLVNLIPRFYDATGGRVFLAGQDIRCYRETALRAAVGVVPQQAMLFAGTLRDNLLWGKETRPAETRPAGAEEKEAEDEGTEKRGSEKKGTEKRRAEEKEFEKKGAAGVLREADKAFAPAEEEEEEILLRAVKIAQASDILEQKGGLSAKVEAGGRNFSGGQRQRLTIARALTGRPSLLILDDSSSALDYATDAALRASLAEASEGMSVIYVSQRASGVMHADKILVLEDGAPVDLGTSDELLARCPLYREIYETQFPPEEADIPKNTGNPENTGNTGKGGDACDEKE